MPDQPTSQPTSGERAQDHHIPSVDVCGFCGDSECDGIGCIASLDPNDERDLPAIENLHALLREGRAWRIMASHPYPADAWASAEWRLATAEHREPWGPTHFGGLAQSNDLGQSEQGPNR